MSTLCSLLHIINLDSFLLCNHGDMFMACCFFHNCLFHALIGCKITINTSFITKINNISKG